MSAGHAKSYFNDALLKSDYYLEDQELAGNYQGKLAHRLGIEGRADKHSFYALCDNRHPVTAEPMTPRTRETERKVGYDINFHVPKSVSVVHVLSGDDHILEAFRASVKETMTDIEADMMVRIRKDGAVGDKQTGEMLFVDFIHQTARPVDDHKPDPHLHAHVFCVNATYDEADKQVRAGQFRDIKTNMPYYQALFHKRISDRLMDMGYTIRRTDKSFEIVGVPKKVIEHFSKRTNEIGEIAKEKGITDAKELSELGARTRAKKQKGISMSELKSDWRSQIREIMPDNAEGKNIIRQFDVEDRKIMSPQPSIDYALDHCFERASVMSSKRVLASALKHSIGRREHNAAEVVQCFEADKRLIQIEDKGQKVSTTKEVLGEEQQMVRLARNGQGCFVPLYDQEPEIKATGQQSAAIKHVLTTSDQVSIVRGAAGAGKTTLMQEAVPLIEQTGKKVMVIAPTSTAARDVLRKEGFENAETVAAFLQNRTMQDALKENVLWVDEAGLLGTSDMKSILQIAHDKNARVILGGDTRQHASVVRGDALRILNTIGGIKSAEVSKIYRQKNVAYRQAVEDLAKGNIGGGFEKLDAIGAIRDVPKGNANAELVEDYLGYIKQGKSALVIAPTHKQGEEVTDEIRSHLKRAGKIGKKEIKAEKLNNLSLTQAEKGDWRSFREGQVIQFNQNLTGIKRGSQWSVSKVDEDQVFMTNPASGRTIEVPKEKRDCYDVFERSQIDVAKGDKIRVTRNGFDDRDKRLNNGQVFDVLKVSKKGEIRLQNETSKEQYTINKDHGHIAHAHCVTSHAAQGKTVDAVLISQPAATFPATNAKQFYVSVSRAREQVHIYTDDKEELLKYASKMGDRQSAMELVASDKDKQTAHVYNIIRNDHSHIDTDKTPEIDKAEPTHDLDNERDYDYGLHI